MVDEIQKSCSSIAQPFSQCNIKEEINFETVDAFLLPAIVWHKRFRGKIHELKYKVFYLGVDIDKLHSLNLGILSYNKFNLLSFLNKDHGKRNGEDLRPWINSILDKFNLPEAKHRVILLTMPRYLGYLFNPVSFWFCFNEKGRLVATLAEVNNTFKETHSYVLFNKDKSAILVNQKFYSNKMFHVSPFFLIKGKYEFRFDYKQKSIAVYLNYYDAKNVSEKNLALKTFLAGKKMPLTRKNLLLSFFNYPLQSIKVISLIHFHALLLFIKKIKYNKKPKQKNTKIS